MTIYDKLIALSAEILEKPVDQINPLLSYEELGADSLHIVELLSKVEDSFGIYVPDSAVIEMRSIADLATWLEDHQ
ncbi:MAG: acyl carrier protein [Clostridia bacterium]|nr:acyl carrier protein [Clostridia bacterium]